MIRIDDSSLSEDHPGPDRHEGHPWDRPSSDRASTKTLLVAGCLIGAVILIVIVGMLITGMRMV